MEVFPRNVYFLVKENQIPKVTCQSIQSIFQDLSVQQCPARCLPRESYSLGFSKSICIGFVLGRISRTFTHSVRWHLECPFFGQELLCASALARPRSSLGLAEAVRIGGRTMKSKDYREIRRHCIQSSIVLPQSQISLMMSPAVSFACGR